MPTPTTMITEASSRPASPTGYLPPYPTVDIVTSTCHKASEAVVKFASGTLRSKSQHQPSAELQDRMPMSSNVRSALPARWRSRLRPTFLAPY